MSDVTQIHEEKETLSVDINIPGHEARTTTALFTHTRKALLALPGAACWICGAPHTPESPLESHHYPVERSLAGMVDWDLVKADALAGELGLTQRQRDANKTFDWATFEAAGDLYAFVDDQLHNGVLLCKLHHIGRDEGIHAMPHPLWVAQRYGKEGYNFSSVEIIHHQDTENVG